MLNLDYEIYRKQIEHYVRKLEFVPINCIKQIQIYIWIPTSTNYKFHGLTLVSVKAEMTYDT